MSKLASRPVAANPARGTMIKWALVLTLLARLIAAPFFFHPIFLMKLLCFALFASAFNLLLGCTGLLSFGHATFFGGAAYATAHSAKILGE